MVAATASMRLADSIPPNLDQNKRQELRSHFCLDENTIVIGFVGRLVKDKGVVELASAWKRIRNAYSHSRLLTIGPAEPHNPYRMVFCKNWLMMIE